MTGEISVARLSADTPLARPADFEALVAMMERTGRLHATFEEGFTLAPGWAAMQRGWLARVVGDPDWYVALAFVGGEAVGCVMATAEYHPPIYVHPHRGWLSDVWVEERWRRRGVARTLIAAAEDWLREQGISRIELSVAQANTAAQAVYARLGYHLATLTFARDFDQ